MNLWQDPLRNPVDKFMELYMKKRLDKLLEYFSEKKSWKNPEIIPMRNLGKDS